MLSRTTSSVGISRWSAVTSVPARVSAIARVRAAAAARPFASTSWRTVVSAGRIRAARGLSSNPITDRSSGTRKPRSYAAWTTPCAMASEKHSTAVGRGSDSRMSRAPS
ncbi:hypothetical protein GCM10027610_143140 [Dactylosporangium cerinum]